MGPIRRRSLSALILLSLFAILSLDRAYAQQPPPRLAFIGPDSVSITPGGKPVQIQLQNNTAESLAVDVSLIDIEPKSSHPITEVINFPPQTVNLKPAGSEIITITSPPKSPDDQYPDFGKGYLVAIEREKPSFDRRLIQIEHSTSPLPLEIKEAVRADMLPKLNFSGINFVPSLISSLIPTLFTVLLILVPLIAWRLFKKTKYAIGTFIGLLLLGSVLGTFLTGELWRALGPSGIFISKVPLKSPKGLLGGIISADADLGRLESDGAQLRVTDIKRAGKYEGNIKLPVPGKESRDVEVTVDVSDWWPYAFLTIALGVLFGYYLTRYYKEQRGEDELRLRGAQLWRRVTDEESRFQTEHSRRPYAGYRIVEATKEWLTLTEKDLLGAKARLDGLDKYINMFAQFRIQLVNLYDLRVRTWTRVEQDIDLPNVRIFQQADEALKGEPFSYPPEDEQGTILKERQTQVLSLTDWMRDLEDTLTLIDGWLQWACAVDTSTWVDADKKTCDDQIQTLRDKARAAVSADKKDSLTDCGKDAAIAFSIIWKLHEQYARRLMLLQSPDVRTLTQPIHLNTMRMSQLYADYLPSEPTAGKKVRDIEVQSIDSRFIAFGDQHPGCDDLVIFTAQVTVPPQLAGDCKLQWDFGDDVTSNIQFPAPKEGEGVTLETSHRYSKGGSFKVTLRKLSGEILKSAEQLISQSPTRSERLLASFRLTQWQMSVIAGLIAIGLGFYTVYLSKSVWGTPADYLYALLWGSVVSEGLKYAANLVSRVWSQQ